LVTYWNLIALGRGRMCISQTKIIDLGVLLKCHSASPENNLSCDNEEWELQTCQQLNFEEKRNQGFERDCVAASSNRIDFKIVCFEIVDAYGCRWKLDKDRIAGDI
jgi:hypothetical protein